MSILREMEKFFKRIAEVDDVCCGEKKELVFHGCSDTLLYVCRVCKRQNLLSPVSMKSPGINRNIIVEQLELELAELRQQVEKMKSCDNCEDNDHDTYYGNSCCSDKTLLPISNSKRDSALCLDHGKKFWRLKI